MGFVSGFFGGFALTTSVLYITLQVHRSNRQHQHQLIREQIEMLDWLASSAGAYDRRFAPYRPPVKRRFEELKHRKPSTKDMLKERWNQEVETLARRAYETRWEDVRETALVGFRTIRSLMKKE
ncbi:hypothetical protein VTN02DRAFT_829 [Thermoascus thermophilus]